MQICEPSGQNRLLVDERRVLLSRDTWLHCHEASHGTRKQREIKAAINALSRLTRSCFSQSFETNYLHPLQEVGLFVRAVHVLSILSYSSSRA